MKNIILVLFALTACKVSENRNGDHNEIQLGKYMATSGTFFDKAQWYLEGKRSIAVGASLVLKENNKFNFKACSCQSNGDWTFRNDTLYLKEQEYSFTSIETRKNLKNCLASNYLLSNNRLYKVSYLKTKYVESLELVKN